MEQPDPPLPAEAQLIRRARQAHGLSPERAVRNLRHVTMSGRAWRLYEDGDRRAPDDSLAHMAYAVGVTPEQLAEAGRGEAAEILREIIRQDRAGEDRHPPEVQKLLARMRDDPDYAQWITELVETVRRGQPPDRRDPREDTA